MSDRPPDLDPDLVDSIIAYEMGDLDDTETLALFTTLVNTGLAWGLQGHYGRTAMDLIHAGLILPPAEGHFNDI